MALIFALVFVVEYPTYWPSYFDDIFYAHMTTSSQVADFYMRVLLEIDTEVAAKEIPRTKMEQERCALIKVCFQLLAKS
jgi:hypothetical protein